MKDSFLSSVLIIGLALMPVGSATAQTFTTLKSFGVLGEGSPYLDSGLTLSDGMLYGTGGTIYKVSPNGSGFAVVHRFTGGSEGAHPVGRVVVSGNTIYGVTRHGGISNGGEEHGIIYRVNTDGSDFTVLRRFNKAGGDGYWPAFGLVLADNALYGTALAGGAFNGGVVFKINTSGAGYQNLHSFQPATEGAQPQAELTLVGNFLFGTTDFGRYGAPNGGMLFQVGLDGTGFSVLYTFTNLFSVQNEWLNRLTPVGDTLYGVGFDYNEGKASVYKISLHGSGFNIVRQAPSTSRLGGVLTWTGTALLGTWSDSDSAGGIFQVNTNSTGYQVIKTFGPNTSSVVVDVAWAGTAVYGAAYNSVNFAGTMFSLDVRPRLAIAAADAEVKLSWPSYAHDYRLEQSPALSLVAWTNSTAVVVDDGTNRSITFGSTPGNSFYRLTKP